MNTRNESAFGARLRCYRHVVGLTQEELAERAEVSVRELAYLERGKHAPRPGTIRRLGEALGLSEEEHAILLASVQEVPERMLAVRARARIPVPPTPFIGREREVAAIADLMRDEDIRLLALTGPGGSGKTRLAIQVAHGLPDAFPDGVVFVPLGALTDPTLVAFAIASVLDVKELPGRPLVETLRSYLRAKRLLLLLDNFEHLLPAAFLVSELLATCPHLKFLVTSRAVLHLAAEYDYPVSPLAVPDPGPLPTLGTLIQYDAVALFVERARAAKATFTLTGENAPAVVEVCRRLDGLPLAIELAAARTRLLSPPALLGRLESRLEVLTEGARDVPVRQQTLRSTIAWSYELLTGSEQTLFRRLAVFVGGCTLEEAKAVCADAVHSPVEVLLGLEALVDQSLLVVDEQDVEPRFRMLETVREYALERLAASRETEQVRRRHAEAFLRLAEEADGEGDATERSVWLARLERENDNLRAALAWSLEQEDRGEMALRLAGALAWFWFERVEMSEGRRWLERSLAVATSSRVAERYPRARARVVTGIGHLASREGDFATAQTYAEQGVGIWRALHDRRGLASALGMLAWVARRQGDHVQARSLLDELVELSQDEGTMQERVWALRGLGGAEMQQGNLAAARSRYEEALALSRQIGDTESLVYQLCTLAEIAWCQGDTAAQRALYEEALAIVQSLRDPVDLFRVSGHLAWVARRLGRYEQAENLLTEWLVLVRGPARAEQNWWRIAWVLNHLGDVARCEGDTGRAASLYEESLTLFRQHGERQGMAAVQHNLGHVALSQGNARHARALFLESLTLFQELDFAWSIADCLTGLAGVAGQEGHPQQAALLYGSAEAAHEAVDASGTLIEPANQLAWEREILAARGEIDAEAWEQAWSDGRAMSIDQALDCADLSNG